MIVTIISFGFKHSAPPTCDFVFDIRSLPDPYFHPELKPLTGKDKAIHDYLFMHGEAMIRWNEILQTIETAYKNGKTAMTIAIGCIGGRHRSVAFVERLQNLVLPNITITIQHRDLKTDLLSN